MKRKNAMLFLGVAVGLLSCGRSSTGHASQGSDIPLNRIIDASRMTELLNRPDVLIVDNRPRTLYREGHLQGAVNMPFFASETPGNEMTAALLKKAASGKSTIVFYCSGRNRAKNALLQATEWGVSGTLYWYRDGYREWTNQDRPVVRP